MLTHIHIENFTIVESLALDFYSGLSVLTGETGAGKSIWVDAISLALGSRAEGDVIRHNQTRCDITLCFDLQHIPAAQAWLEQHEFADEGECLIRRTLQRGGASRSTINGRPCPLALLKEFSNLVINIHSQHQHQALLQREAQRACVDNYGKHGAWLKELHGIYEKWSKLNSELEQLQQQSQHRDSELELLRYQFNELDKLQLQANEWQELSHRHQQLHNAKSLITHLNQAIELTVENEEISASLLLQQAIDRLEMVRVDDQQISSIKELLKTAMIHLQEAGDELNHYRDHIDLSPENLAKIETRLTILHDLARKHHVSPNELIDVTKSLTQKIHALENLDVHLQTLLQAKTQLQQQYQHVADKLSQSRSKIAGQLSKKITEQMQLLGMQGGVFKIELQHQENTFSAYGNERVEFTVSTNPGHPMQPMAKVVSGGELSRISLALQVITAQQDGTPTLIFDEVDTGISGKTAETVGKLLRQLGDSAQVLCITHLPQVAAQGQQHFQVSKISEKNSTRTSMQLLTQAQRVDELARMLGGITISAQTRAHAEEMLSV